MANTNYKKVWDIIKKDVQLKIKEEEKRAIYI